MRFYEFEAKQLMASNRVPTSKGGVANTPEDAERIAADVAGPVVLKSQVLSGGRMKAGGVKFADTPAEAKAAAAEILKLEIKGQLPKGVLIEAKAPVKREYFLAITYDALAKQPVAIFSDMGGIDIEEVAETHPEHIARRHFSALLPLGDFVMKELIASLGIKGGELTALTNIATRLARLFLSADLTLAEVNPLAQLENGSFVALDCHLDMEDEARERHKDILAPFGVDEDAARQGRPPTPFEEAGARADGVDPRGVARVVEFDGNLGLVIGAGGGSLTIMDAVEHHGGKPANYCEIGGNPSMKKTCELTKVILNKPGVDKIAVIMNIVSNTRVDIMARGVIKGCIESGFEPKDKILFFRIPGAWEGEGFKILEKYGVEYGDRTVSMSEAARRAVVKLAGGT
jgi:succinyl-CoA synthetase beta subunit/citryl-CoA synthetase large subunit